MFAPVVREAHGKLPNAPATRAIRRQTRISEYTRHRADVDDASVTVRHHAARQLLCNKEAAPQIGIEHEVPVLPADIESRLAHVASGIVDENMYLATGGFGGGGHPFNAALVPYVKIERDDPAAHRFHLRHERRHISTASAGEDE